LLTIAPSQRIEIVSRQPRTVGAIGLVFAALGVGTAVLGALLGPHSLAGGYLAATALTIAFRVTAVLGGAGIVAALIFARSWGVLVMLAAATFFLGYTGGYFVAQGLGLWYPTQ
jgi:hypothetical protein